MARAVQWLRSLVFVAQMYAAMPVIVLLYLPRAVLYEGRTHDIGRAYAAWVCWSAGWMVGLRTEVRGTPPDGAVLVAAKHQSFLDILMIFGALPRGRFIMKEELLWAPVLGQFARAIGCVPVNRSNRGGAVAKMLTDVAAGRLEPGQLIIYPQGTRLAPGVAAPYKVGPGLLYAQLGQPCVPVAVNVGVFWPRRGIFRRPGTAVVEFLDPIPPGLPRAEFAARLEHAIETASDRLLVEAGFVPPPKRPADHHRTGT